MRAMKTNTHKHKHRHPPGSFKTERCNKCYNFELRQWKKGASCPYGSLCVYAHSNAELRRRVHETVLSTPAQTPLTTSQTTPQTTSQVEHSTSSICAQICENIWAIPNSKSPILMVQSACSGFVDIPCSEMSHLLLSSVIIALQ